MDTRKNSISYASFITKTYYWSVLYLQRKRAFKYLAMLSVVAFCTLTRYVVLSFDRANVKPIKTFQAGFKRVKLPLVSVKIILKSESAELRQKYLLKIKLLNIKKPKSSSFYIYALD